MRIATIAVLTAVSSTLCACSGTRVIEPGEPQQVTQPLASASDPHVEAILDWTIVRNGPGAWAQNANWDEYLLRVRNLSDAPLQVSAVGLYDSLGHRTEPRSERRELIQASKQTARRYSGSGITVKPGIGAAEMLVAGAAATAVGVGAAQAALIGTAFGGTAGAAGAAAGALLLIGPAVAIGGILQGINNHEVSKEILARQTPLPLTVSGGGVETMDLFFPVVPSPGQMEITYVSEGTEHRLLVDTRLALDGLHVELAGSEVERPRRRHSGKLDQAGARARRNP